MHVLFETLHLTTHNWNNGTRWVFSLDSYHCCHFSALSRRQTIDKVGQLLRRGLVSKDNRPMKCTTSKLLTCRVTNGGPIWSAFYVASQSKKSNIKALASLSSAIFWRHNRDVTSDKCHGSTISSADCLRKLNHAQKVGQLYRSSDASFRGYFQRYALYKSMFHLLTYLLISPM